MFTNKLLFVKVIHIFKNILLALADYLEKKKNELGFTDEEMADKLDISSQLFGLYRRGQRNPKMDFYDKWRMAFNEDLETNVSREMFTKEPDQKYITGQRNNKEKSPGLLINNAPGTVIAALLRIEAKLNVLLSAEAERTSSHTDQKATDVLREMNAAVRAEEEGLRAVLRSGEESI